MSFREAQHLRDAERLAGDKGYSYRRIRSWLHRHKMEPVTPQHLDEVDCKAGHHRLDKRAWRRRNVVETCIGWINEGRRVFRRFEKLALNRVAKVKFAMIERSVRAQFSNLG